MQLDHQRVATSSPISQNPVQSIVSQTFNLAVGGTDAFNFFLSVSRMELFFQLEFLSIVDFEDNCLISFFVLFFLTSRRRK